MTTAVTDPEPTDMMALARRCWGTLEPIHVVGYFAPETTAAYVALGLHPKLSYFAARSAAFGPASPALTVATFYVFAPWLVGAALPTAWDVATPDQVQAARRSGVSAALHSVVGEPDPVVVSEALSIAHRVCDGLTAHGRPLYAAHSTLPWPDDDLLALWHAATLIREHRGDGHISVLHANELDPVEALILGGLFSANTDFLKQTRGWSDEEWVDARARLQGRGLLDADGALSDEGHTLRQHIEDRTDALAVDGWAAVGVEDCQRLCDLVRPLRDQVLGSGVLPGWTKSRG